MNRSLTDFNPRRGYAWLFLLFIGSLMLLGRASKGTITEYGIGDDDDYWAYGRSLVYDGDFDFSNEPLPIYQQRANWKNYHSPVPGLMWVPAVAVGRMLGPVIRFLPGASRDGWAVGSSQYQRLIISAFSSALTFLGLLFLFRFLSQLFPPIDAFLASVIALWSTPLMFFTWRRPLMAHSTEFLLLTGAALSLFQYFQRPTRAKAFFLGILLSLAVLVRYPDVFMVAGLLVGFYWQFADEKTSLKRDLPLLIAGGLLPVLLQVFLWHSIYGTFTPPSNNQYSFSIGNILRYVGFSWLTIKNVFLIFIGKDWGLFWMEPPVLFCLAVTLFVFKPLGRLRLWLALSMLPLLAIAANFGTQGGSYGYRYLLVKGIWLSISFAVLTSMIKSVNKKILLTTICCFVPIVFLLLYASGPSCLTLSLAPGRPPAGTVDWVNDHYALNAVSTLVHSPQQLAFAIAGAPLIHFIAALAFPVAKGMLPASVQEKLLDRLNGIPLFDVGWWIFWQIFFVSLIFWIWMRWTRSKDEAGVLANG